MMPTKITERRAGPAWWYELARRDLQSARGALESARAAEAFGGRKWRERQARWFASACTWLLLAAEARDRARMLRRIGAFRGVRP